MSSKTSITKTPKAKNSQAITPEKNTPETVTPVNASPANTILENEHPLVIKVPRDGFTIEKLENLKKIVASKETLIKKALGADNLPIAMEEDTLNFPWFKMTGEDGETDAYTRFICAICAMAKRQSRVIAVERDTTNDKFTMRLFLIRLGFIGEEYRTARRILLKNLTGNGSFKNGQRPTKAITIDNKTEPVIIDNVVSPKVENASNEPEVS